jgi:hypothetical protein
MGRLELLFTQSLNHQVFLQRCLEIASTKTKPASAGLLKELNQEIKEVLEAWRFCRSTFKNWS